MADDTIKTTIRLPQELHERLSRAAERDHRSQHGQLVFYLERGLAQDDRRDKRAATMRGES